MNRLVETFRGGEVTPLRDAIASRLTKFDREKEMEYADCVADLRSSHPSLADRIARFSNLEHILNWLTADGYPLGSLDMITQDEFCHDLLLPIDADWLVFGMT